MVQVSLLLQARARGLRLHIDGERLVIRGPRGEDALAKELLANKAAIVRLLRERPELASVDSFTAEAMQSFEGSTVVDEGDCASASSDPRNRPPARCFNCGHTTWWRRRAASHWTCRRCVEPAPWLCDLVFWPEQTSEEERDE